MNNDNISQPAAGAPRDSLVTTAHVVYGLHAFSLLIGASSFVTLVGAFVFGIPSIIAVILNYANERDARGSFLESHFRWQIRTFWFAALWGLIAVVLIVTIIGFFAGIIVAVGAGLWVIYRIVSGWLALSNREPVGSPD